MRRFMAMGLIGLACLGCGREEYQPGREAMLVRPDGSGGELYLGDTLIPVASGTKVRLVAEAPRDEWVVRVCEGRLEGNSFPVAKSWLKPIN